MDATERIAKTYLELSGFTNPVYEPAGNVPPDFLLNGRVAVEVRRLNEHILTASGPQGLEIGAVPLNRTIKEVLASLGPPTDGRSWYVFYSFHRPILSRKDIRKRLIEALTMFNEHRSVDDVEIIIDAGLKLRISQAGRIYSQRFVFGGYLDRQSGGFVVPVASMNVRTCIDEKTRKFLPFIDKYSYWWLVLVDSGYCAAYGSDTNELRQSVTERGPWQKIIIVNAADFSKSFEL